MKNELKRNWKEILKDYVVKVKSFFGKAKLAWTNLNDYLDEALEVVRKSWLFIAMTLATIAALIGMF